MFIVLQISILTFDQLNQQRRGISSFRSHELPRLDPLTFGNCHVRYVIKENETYFLYFEIALFI